MGSSSLYCIHCGAANLPQAAFCLACGQPLQNVARTLTGMLGSGSLLKQRYRLLAQVGRGGFGAVYQGEDTLLGQRLIALKEMSQNGLSPQELKEATDAFQQEGALLATLHHPSLPAIYDYFQEAGRWYLVMEWIPGETLERHLAQAPSGHLSVQEVLQIGLQLCEVLTYLHSRQPSIIFRDLKPSNVMLTATGHLYLIDFGIARLFKPGQMKDTVAFGSPGYAAPEQYGKAQTTPRSDIYSLGALLHQMLSGHDPSTNQPLLWDFPPLPASVPRALATVVQQMVQPRPEDRPESTAAITSIFQRMVKRKSTSQSQPRVPSRVTRQPVVLQAPPTLALLPDQVSLPPPLPVRAPLPPVQGQATPSLSRRGVIRGLGVAGVLLVGGGVIGGVTLWLNSAQSVFTYQMKDTVNAVAWSPTSDRIVSVCADGAAQVWDALDGANILFYRDHDTTAVNTVDWLADSTKIAIGLDHDLFGGAQDHLILIWDGVTGKTLLTCRGHSDDVLAVAWSPEGTRLASGSEDQTAKVWEASTGAQILTYKGHNDEVRCVAWSPDSTRIASASKDQTVQIWGASTGIPLATLKGHTDAVNALAWSPDGTQLASGSDDQTVHLWDTTTGSSTLIYRGHTSSVTAVAWSPDGKRIASAGGTDDQTVQVWSSTDLSKVFTYTGHKHWYSSDGINTVAWSPNGDYIASGGVDASVQVWKPREP